MERSNRGQEGNYGGDQLESKNWTSLSSSQWRGDGRVSFGGRGCRRRMGGVIGDSRGSYGR